MNYLNHWPFHSDGRDSLGAEPCLLPRALQGTLQVIHPPRHHPTPRTVIACPEGQKPLDRRKEATEMWPQSSLASASLVPTDSSTLSAMSLEGRPFYFLDLGFLSYKAM